MSYARFGWEGSDVYVYLDVDGYLTCCGCVLQEREWVNDPNRPIFGGYFKPIGELIVTRFETTAALLAHLDRHRAEGHCVTDDTYESLRDDAEENDAWIVAHARGVPHQPSERGDEQRGEQ